MLAKTKTTPMAVQITALQQDHQVLTNQLQIERERRIGLSDDFKEIKAKYDQLVVDLPELQRHLAEKDCEIAKLKGQITGMREILDAQAELVPMKRETDEVQFVPKTAVARGSIRSEATRRSGYEDGRPMTSMGTERRRDMFDVGR